MTTPTALDSLKKTAASLDKAQAGRKGQESRSNYLSRTVQTHPDAKICKECGKVVEYAFSGGMYGSISDWHPYCFWQVHRN